MTSTRMIPQDFYDKWKTPKNLYDKLDQEFHFDFDPCPSNPTFDAFSLPQWGNSNYVNPPYGKEIRRWILRAIIERLHNRTTVFLLPAYTDVKWFHELILPQASEIRFIKGRLHFNESKDPAPFASMIVVFRP